MTETNTETENTENTEKTPELAESAEVENNDITTYFTHERTPDYDVMITQYFEEFGKSPFTDIQMEETDQGNVQIDMENDFHEKALEVFGDDLDIVTADYVQSLIKSVMKDITPEEMKEMADEYAEYQESQEGIENVENEKESDYDDDYDGTPKK